MPAYFGVLPIDPFTAKKTQPFQFNTDIAGRRWRFTFRPAPITKRWHLLITAADGTIVFNQMLNYGIPYAISQAFMLCFYDVNDLVQELTTETLGDPVRGCIIDLITEVPS